LKRDTLQAGQLDFQEIRQIRRIRANFPSIQLDLFAYN
jgi:hypothetical protein